MVAANAAAIPPVDAVRAASCDDALGNERARANLEGAGFCDFRSIN
jgi:hypothetical protein